MKIILGITGSVAASLTSKMKEALESKGHEVQIVATDRSLFFIPSEDQKNLHLLKDKYEWTEGGHFQKGDPVHHINYCEWADILLIAPLSANTLADIATGRADKFLTSIARAWPTGKYKAAKPFIIAPAMNSEMWFNPITKAQIKMLKKRYKKFKCVYPRVGPLACGGQPAMGAMALIENIVSTINSINK